MTCRPSGAKGIKIQGATSVVGARFPCPAGWGTQRPTNSMVCDNTTLRSSGARGLDVSRCYRHIAPLERKARTHQNSRHGIHVGARLPCRMGWGSQRLRVSTTRYLRVVALNNPSVLRITYYVLRYHMSPLWGFGVFGVCRRAINIPPLWG